MTIVQVPRGRRMSPRFGLVIGVAMWLGHFHAPCSAAADEPTLKALIEQMLAVTEQQPYDPQPLVKHGITGMRAVLNEMLPEVADDKEPRTERMAMLIEQLGNESFARREAASAALRHFGAAANDLLRQAMEHQDAEIRSRARALLEQAAKPLEAKAFLGLQQYLAHQKEVECRVELARRLNLALTARLDVTSKKTTLEICCSGISALQVDRAQDDRVQAELLPLLKLKDAAPVIFALQHNRGSERYVTPLHRGALASGRAELIRVACQTLPRPMLDKTSAPLIHATLEKFFDGSEMPAELLRDSSFLLLIANDAVRDFQSVKARQWLVAKITKGSQVESLVVLKHLGNPERIQKEMDPELLAAVEVCLKSRDAQFREAATRMLAMYRGAGIPPLLLRAFADPASYVWKRAGESLKTQHTFYKAEGSKFFEQGASPIPGLLEEALRTTQDAAHKTRLEFLLKNLQQEPTRALQWPDEEKNPVVLP
jgi:hypothetical protein